MLISFRTFLGISLAGVALLLANPASSQTPSGTNESDYYDMTTYFEVQPTDSNYVYDRNYVNLGNDQFLVGAQVWNVPTNTFTWADRSPSISVSLLRGLHQETNNWIRLGDSLAGTLFSVRNSVLWWDGKNRRIAAELLLNENEHLSHLLSLGTHHALLCLGTKDPKTLEYSYYSKVARLQQADDKSSLAWEMSNSTEVRSALLAAMVVGTVKGFSEVLAETDITRPAYYDATQCRWQVKNPESIKPFADKRYIDHLPDFSRYLHNINIKFLSDGRTLLSDGRFVRNSIFPPMRWQESSHSWVEIEHVIGDDSQAHLAGQHKPVIYHSFQPQIIEFLDTNTMHWFRFKQRVTSSFGIEPLSNGDALIFNRDGKVGIISPKFDPPLGKLSLTRAGHHEGEVVLQGGGLMLVGGEGQSNQPSTRSEIISVTKGKSQLAASLPTPLVSPYGLELKDGSVLIFGELPRACHPAYYPNQPQICLTTFLYFPQENRWQALPNLTIPVTRGFSLQSGSSQWVRNDALVRRNGDVVWIEGGEVFDSEKEKLPQTSSLMHWQESLQNQASQIVARLRKARKQSTVLELDDGRLVVIGGFAQLERVALKKECFFDCPDEFVSIGPFQAARSTEILDESNITTPFWQVGPLAHYGGGRALKLANGRIFKLSLISGSDEQGYHAEIADATFTNWGELPPFPLADTSIRNLSVVGNKVVMLTNKNQTVAWDDDAKTWLIWTEWPKVAGSGDNRPISITALADAKRVLIRYSNSFEIVNLP